MSPGMLKLMGSINGPLQAYFKRQTFITEFIWDLRATNVLVIFENDLSKIADMKALTRFWSAQWPVPTLSHHPPIPAMTTPKRPLALWGKKATSNPMTLWHVNVFHITGPLWEETTATGGFLSRRASNVEVWCFIYHHTSLSIFMWRHHNNNSYSFSQDNKLTV